MLRHYTWLLLIVILFSCTGPREKADNGIIIRGKFSNAESVVLYIEELTTNEVMPVDTVLTDQDGSFYYTNDIEDAGFYIIRKDQENFITLLVEPGEKIFLQGDANNLIRTYEVDGSEGSLLLATLNKNQYHNKLKLDSLARIFRSHKYEDDFHQIRKEIDMAFTKIFDDQQKYIMRFVRGHPYSLASVIALYQYTGSRLLLNMEEHFSYFEDLCMTLTEAYPLNKHVMDLKRRVNEYKRNEAQRLLAEKNLAPGAFAPEIVLPDPEGNQISLSSLRGKVVLLDFWAAWCPPCRESNRRLRRIYEEYKPLGFEIYAVSLDRTFDQWVLGIEEDGASWIQVSDLRFWNSPVVSLYNVTAIPHTVLIDKEGKIIEKGVTPRELRAILNMMLQ
jgi:peroxiredoxin